jgi:SRSO17 transposase
VLPGACGAVHAAKHFAKGTGDPGFRTKLAIERTWRSGLGPPGFAIRAVAAGSAYGNHDGFRAELAEAGLPFVMALKPRRGTWACGPDARRTSGRGPPAGLRWAQ